MVQVKSEPVPKNNDAPVTVVVSDSFDDEVMKDKRPVLLEFYAPWCVRACVFAHACGRLCRPRVRTFVPHVSGCVYVDGDTFGGRRRPSS